MSIEILALVAVLAAAVAGYVLFKRRGNRGEAAALPDRERDDIDTVTGWPPEVTRLLSGGERSAHETLVKALPECMIFAQVPLARFIRVPRRNSYGDWLTRVGHLSADFLICDRASLVIGAVSLQAVQESERAARRRARMARVLKAAGVKFFTWREQAIPTPAAARDQITQRIGVPSAAADSPAGEAPQTPQARTGHAKIPVPEVVVVEAPVDEHGREPPSSTWFDDLDSGAQRDSVRKQSGA